MYSYKQLEPPDYPGVFWLQKRTPGRKTGSSSIFFFLHLFSASAGNKREQLVLLIEYPAISAIQRSKGQSQLPVDDWNKQTDQPA